MLNSISESLLESVKRAVWQQWQALGAMVSGTRKAKAIVDPEALILLSLELRDHERRLRDMLAWWAGVGARLLSIQRIRNLAAKYPEPIQYKLTEFARLAYETGGDFRWKIMVSSGKRSMPRMETKRETEPELIEPAALILRLRMGIGVGIKADVLSFLLGIGGAWASVRDIGVATHYSNRAIRRAADELVAARLIHSKAETSTQYHVSPKPWTQLLQIKEPLPSWRYWQAVFVFVAHFLKCVEEDKFKEATYLASTQARDLFEQHRSAFSWNQISVPDPKDFRGTDYLDGFEDTVLKLAQWLEENV
jgi:hypothetical protein